MVRLRMAPTHRPAPYARSSHLRSSTCAVRPPGRPLDLNRLSYLLDMLTLRLRYEGRVCRAWHASLPGGDAHAGRTETSIMLTLAPRTVHMTAATIGNTRPIEELMPALQSGGVRAVSPNGVIGDPRGASAAEGRRLLAGLAAGLSETLRGLLGDISAPIASWSR